MTNKYQHPLLHNTRRGTAPEGAIYIGRGSDYGNPFFIGTHGTRDQVCELYIERTLPKIPKARLEFLRGKHLRCFCSSPNDPNALRCHGHAILDYLERTANEQD